MATWSDVRRIALALPETDEQSTRDGIPQWRVRPPGEPAGEADARCRDGLLLLFLLLFLLGVFSS